MNTIDIDNLLLQNHFSIFVIVESRLSIADLFKQESRCGIYVLRFKDGQYYVGQATDVTRRYAQHLKNHNDVQEIAFRILPKEKLNQIEQVTIKVLESAGAKLRNIFFTSYPVGESDLDLVVPKTEQEDFLHSFEPYKLQPQILNLPEIRLKNAIKFRKLLNHTAFELSVLPVLNLYINKCLLKPEWTEMTFWSLTCMTKAFLDSDLIALCRINLYRCEVLTIWINFYGEIFYTFHLTRSLLPKPVIRSLRLKTLTCSDQIYERAGLDQVQVEVAGVSEALKLLDNDRVILAIRSFNLRQMQKGPTIYSRYHCLDLTKYIFTQTVSIKS